MNETEFSSHVAIIDNLTHTVNLLRLDEFIEEIERANAQGPIFSSLFDYGEETLASLMARALALKYFRDCQGDKIVGKRKPGVVTLREAEDADRRNRLPERQGDAKGHY